MNEQILQEAGLTQSQASTYTALVKNSPCTPPKLALVIEESRTNTYKLLEQLESLGLASRDDSQKKLRYWANNPSALVDHIKKQRLRAEEAEKRFNNSLPNLINDYLAHSERPAIRFFQGKEGIESMYDDQLNTKLPLSMVRTPADITFFGSFNEMSAIRSRFNHSTISRHMLTPDTPEARVDWKEHDKKSGNTRTWLRTEDYTAPVEWAVYGNKLAIISFGEEVMGMVIESPQIAEAFRQLLSFVDKGARAYKGYPQLPRKASVIIDDETKVS